MPPRIPVLTHLSVTSLCFRLAPVSKTSGPITFIATKTTKAAQRRRHRDPYALAQAQSRKDASLSRRKELEEERQIARGDPVRGITTPFLESFDTVDESTVPIDFATSEAGEGVADGVKDASSQNSLLNHYLDRNELEESIKHSYNLTAPIIAEVRDSIDPNEEAVLLDKHEAAHKRATAALTRIVNLSNASSKDKTRANIVRCIETFGRHNTDQTLRPRPPVSQEIMGGQAYPEQTPRAGLDTGSSEVQIAILTAKIRVLATELEKGKKDKINKRNLRVLVHRRQKLLNYLRRKERGGDRWQHLIETLGLGEATYKGEISL